MKFSHKHITFFSALVCVFMPSSIVANESSADVLFDKHCAVCHAKPEDVKIPSRIDLEAMSKTRIRHALTSGAMQIYTKDFSTNEIRNMVDLLGMQPVIEDTDAGMCPELPISTEVVVSHWGVDTNNTRNQEMSQVESSNVEDLELKWAFGIPDVNTVRSYPAISADTIFLPTTNGKLYAIDRDVGCTKWILDIEEPWRTSAFLGHVGSNPVVFASTQTELHTIDPTNGTLIRTSDVGISPQSMLTGSPVLYAEDVLMPISAWGVAAAMNPQFECCTSHGAVSRIGSTSGEIMWTTHMTPPAKPTYKNEIGTQMYGPSGAPVWTTPAIDTTRGLLYIGTGENTSTPATDKSDAIVAIEMETGDIRWHFQGTQGDAFNMACGRRGTAGASCPKERGPDFDFGASPVLVKNSKGEDVLLAGQKSGDVWALDPDDGELLWNNRLSRGSALGGVHWGITVVDNVVYVPIADPPPPFGAIDSNPGVFALNIDDGTEIWSYKAARACEFTFDGRRRDQSNPWPECPFHFAFSSAATSTNDVVFVGALDGKVYAFKADTGDILWTFDSKKSFETINGVTAHGGAIDNPGVAIAGSDVIVLSGYGMFGQMPGNVMLVFSLED